MSKPSRRKYEDLVAENERLKVQLTSAKRYGLYSGTTKVLGDLIRVGRVVCPWIFIWLSIRDLSGRTTTAVLHASLESESVTEVLKTFLTQNTFSMLCVAIGAAGLTYGKAQAKLRKDDVERLHKYKVKYERNVDPNRSTSKLTARGETHPKDE